MIAMYVERTEKVVLASSNPELNLARKRQKSKTKKTNDRQKTDVKVITHN